jgi:hypothetical protein
MPEHNARPPTLPTPVPTFQVHFREAYHGLRGAFTELFSTIGADPNRPRDVSRQLGLNHNLCWRVCKIVTARDEFVSAHHVPGETALASLLQAARNVGATEPALQGVREAMVAYDEMVLVHSGDRNSLEQLTAGLSRDAGSIERVELSRRQAFLGLCGTWGVRADVQHTTMVVAPSRSDPSMLTCVLLAGMVGFRRLRADVKWPIFGRYVHDDTGTGVLVPRGDPVDAESGPGGPPFIAAFCSDDLPQFESQLVNEYTQFLLPPGPVGNSASFTCVFGTIDRAVVPRQLSEESDEGGFFCKLSTPTERLQFDVLVSDELSWEDLPQAGLYNRLHGPTQGDEQAREGARLPLLEPVQELGRGVSNMASSHVPRYTDLLRVALDKVGWDADAFRGFRLAMSYPPIPTTAAMWWPLPAAD